LPGKGSVHQLGVADLLVALRVLARQQPTVVLLGVQPATTEWGTELSPAVGAVMGSLIEAAVAELIRVEAIRAV
jgi:hydrogenase maturation protease